jgi:chemotaxis protein histidine kinase CheA
MALGTFHGVKTYNQISVGLLEMSSGPKSMRKTRRSSRQVVLDELELVMRRLEQIKNMVDKHCVAPLKEKEPSVRSQIVAHLQSKAQAQQEAQAKAEAEAGTLPLTPVQEEEEAAPEAPEAAAPEEAEAAEPEPSKLALSVEPAAPKRRKSGGCPGGPKAYNEFVKKWLAEQRAAGKEMTYQEALKVIKQNNIYTQSCGLPPKKNKTRKLNKGNQVPQTPGRVNAPYVPYVQNSPNASSLAPASASASGPASVKERGKSLPPTAANLEKQESERKYLEEGIASRRAAREAEEAGLPPIKEEATPSPMETEAEAEAESPSSLASPAPAPVPEPAPAPGYEDLGMNDNLGMRKISVNGRKLLMTNGNSGLFEDMNGAPGEFVGYLKNGKVTASSPPEV